MQVSDEKLAAVLRRYADIVENVLDDPEHWLGVDDGTVDESGPDAATGPATGPDSASDDRPSGLTEVPRTVARAVGRTVLGDTPPASAGWSSLSADERSAWWTRRIGVVAGLAAAAPRYAGALADRVPLQAALGTAAAGLAVCAVAREHGRRTPQEWVPLLGRVLFSRDLSAALVARAEPAAEPEPDPDGAGPEGDGAPDPARPQQSLVRRAPRTLWRLARTFGAISSLFDERPRGSVIARGVAKVPVIGVAGGWVDERGAIHKAARETARLVSRPT